ncbi:MAG: rRNA maturation RNase YbeY [Lachnospiraceae bacterium]|nr:rRNA maturation RNase YbeY [Lachnospiraceae bacterium]MBO4558915.1 rRNA maturation RNase YbeY [Lachnospiraceae bacterium]
MTLLIENETEASLDIDIEKEARSIIEFVLDKTKCPWECEVNLTITDNPGIHRLNKEFRDIDRPTDVLSFPMADFPKAGDFSWLDDGGEDCFNPDTGELMLGDIVISADKVLEQAKEYGHSVRREFCFLIVHSMLHLIGYDHIEESDRLVMEPLQKQILDDAGINR